VTTADASAPARGRVLVTGGGGFLGRAIVERLLARGDRVRVFARGTYPELIARGAELIRGDITDREAVSAACRGCDVVIHVAARAGVWGTYREFFEPNVRGTEHVVAACRAAGVARLVFTSSPSVVFDGRDLENADESLAYPRRFASHYSATKALAEQLVLAANDRHLRTLALRPHLVWGPRDPHIVPRLIAQARAGRLVQVGDGHNRIDSTYIDNAAEAHLLAADALASNPNAAGRAYFITNGQPLPAWELINRILAAAGLPPVRRRISRRTARIVGAGLEAVHRVLRLPGEPRLTRFLADELATSHWFNISAAARELGYAPRITIAEGLKRLEDWLRGSPDPAAQPPQAS